MTVRLQSLESLRYFEAAARHLSFTEAAADLCITQSAVSQKIIQLESRLGYPLFERKVRQLTLTDKGVLLYQSVHSALNQIRHTLDELEVHEPTSQLSVYCLPSFATQWLMPCLNDFHELFPNIDVNLSASIVEPNFHHEQIDIGILHGAADDPLMEKVLLFKDYVYPVASPRLLEKTALNTPRDLAKTDLLHDSLPQEKLATSWQQWLLDRNISDIDYNTGYKFNQVGLIIEAAIDAQGVALAHHSLVAKEIKNGSLVPVFDEVGPAENVYLVCLSKYRERPQVAAFYEWVQEKAAIFEAQYNLELLIPSSSGANN